MKKLITAILFMTLMCSLICTDTAFAGEIDEIPVKEEDTMIADSNKLVYSSENVKNGIISVPAGTYDTIQVKTNLKKAVLYLDNVTVKKYISVYGGKSRKITIVMTGNSKVTTMNFRRSGTIICEGKKTQVGKVVVRGEELSVEVDAITKNIEVTGDSSNVSVTVNRKSNNLTLEGTCNKVTTYGETNKAYIYGDINKFFACENVNETNMCGMGNRLAIMTPEFGKVFVSGTNSLIVGQTPDNSRINMGEILVSNGSYQLVRKELLGQVTDIRDMAYVNDAVPAESEILFVGDSFIEYLYMNGLLKKNMSALFAHGTSPYDWYRDGEKHVEYLKDLADYNPKKIVYYYGINGISDPENIEYSKKLLSQLMESYPNATIYVQKIFPVTSGYSGVGIYEYNVYNHTGELSVDKYNAEMRKYCGLYGRLVWSDCTEGFIDGNGDLKRSYSKDALHLTSDGYRKWFDNIKSAIKF